MLNSRLKVQKEKKHSYLNGSAFALVFLRAKHAGAICSVCNFEHTISRLVLTYESLNKKGIFHKRELKFALKLLESTIPSPPALL